MQDLKNKKFAPIYTFKGWGRDSNHGNSFVQLLCQSYLPAAKAHSHRHSRGPKINHMRSTRTNYTELYR